MKKYTFFLILLAAFAQFSNGQSFLSISPNSGVRGTSLTTTVTATGFNFTMASAPSYYDFSMVHGATQFYTGSTNVLDNDHFTALWTIPANAPIGNYDVQWYTFNIFTGWVTYFVPGGFTIGDAFISGKVFLDSDSSGTQNGTENAMFNQKLLLLPDSSYTFTDANGNYTFAAANGIRTVQVVPSPIWNITTPSSITNTLSGSNITGVDFGLKGISDIYSIDVSITGGNPPRCWLPATYIITYTNTGTVVTHGEVKLIRSNNAAFNSSNPAPDQNNGVEYTWNYTNLLPGETRNIYVMLQLPGNGFYVLNSAQANAQDVNNNIMYTDEQFLNQNVLCSYDPNDKTVIPEGVQVPHYTLMNDSLDFVIRFQNTGNDTAFKVVIVDTLNTAILDLSTFSLITYSHPVSIDLRTNGQLTMTFDNILLPDSTTNEPLSHGWIRFRCLAKPGLANNTVLNNRSFIYFDLNPPVLTNTTMNTLVYQIPTGINEHNVSSDVTVMPNPVTEDATILFGNPNAEKFTVKIYNTRGQLINVQSSDGNKFVVGSKYLGKGVYFYELKNENGKVNYSGKFVVL